MLGGVGAERREEKAGESDGDKSARWGRGLRVRNEVVGKGLQRR